MRSSHGSLDLGVIYVNGSRIINLWQGYQDVGDSLLQWAQSQGHQVHRITVDTLPVGEALVVDRASVEELAELIAQSEALAGYLKTMPIVYVLRSDERLYPASLKFGFGSVAAVVVEGNMEGLIEALCPTQFAPLIRDFVRLFGPPTGFGEKSTFEVDDFIDASPATRKAISSCGACKARVMEQIHDLELRLTLQNLIKEKILREAILQAMSATDFMSTGSPSGQVVMDDEEVGQVSDQLKRLANQTDPTPDADPEVTVFFHRLPPDVQVHLAECEEACDAIATMIVQNGTDSIDPQGFVLRPHGADTTPEDFFGTSRFGKRDDDIGFPIGNPFGGAGFQVIPVDLSDPAVARSLLEAVDAPPELISLIMGLTSASTDPDGVDRPQDI